MKFLGIICHHRRTTQSDFGSDQVKGQDQGDLIAKTRSDNEAENPKECCLLVQEGGQLGEAGEHPLSQLTGAVPPRNGHSLAKGRRKERGNKGGPHLASHKTPKCDEARERSGTTGRLPAPRSQKQPDDQTGEVETHEREP